jgi:hypothetical protein
MQAQWVAYEHAASSATDNPHCTPGHPKPHAACPCNHTSPYLTQPLHGLLADSQVQDRTAALAAVRCPRWLATCEMRGRCGCGGCCAFARRANTRAACLDSIEASISTKRVWFQKHTHLRARHHAKPPSALQPHRPRTRAVRSVLEPVVQPASPPQPPATPVRARHHSQLGATSADGARSAPSASRPGPTLVS